MAAKIIVSYDGTDADDDALALGGLLSSAGAELALAYVRHSHEQDEHREEVARKEAEALLEAGAKWLGEPDVPRFVVMSPSTPEGLRDLAEREGAEAVVFGSEYRTTPGHVLPGTSARRLLEGGPLAVAIAPAGLQGQRDLKIETIGAVDEPGDPSARETAESVARSLGATVSPRPGDGKADLLVVGSRPGIVTGRVTISAAAEYLIETVRCPVLVVPRGRSVRFHA